MGKIQSSLVSFGGWDNCVRLTNGKVELIVTTEVGPRIIRYAFVGGPNIMCEKEGQMGDKNSSEWRIYGGHRLWHSPESMPRTYELDNTSVRYELTENGVNTYQDVEKWAQIEKQMEITMDEKTSEVTVVHRIINRGAWEIEASAWAMSVLSTGGKEIIPQDRTDTGLLSNRVMAIWPYTHLDDPRVCFGHKYITLRQDPAVAQPFKIGTSNTLGWTAYFNHNNCLVKYFDVDKELPYPDHNTCFQTYTCDFMLEMETLSPLYLIGTDEAIEHREVWNLFDNIQMPSDDEDEISEVMGKLLKDVEV